MQINLSNTTHILEVETATSATLHYQVGYTDITSTGVSTPSDNQGTISSATTSTILSAPAASTTRKVQYLNIFNAGTTPNTIKLKKDISGTEYIMMQVVLQVGEALRIVNDQALVFDSSGRVKAQNTGDSEFGGISLGILKIGTGPEAAGSFYSHSKDSGFPGAWAPGTPGVNGRNTDGTNSSDAGCFNVGNASSGAWYLRDLNISGSQTGQFLLHDVLWVNSGLVVTTTTAQSITQPTLPARDLAGSTNGLGVFAGVLVTSATTNAGAITNMTMSYTNSDGTSGRTATIASFPATAAQGTFVSFLLQAGDKGIRSIQSVTLGTSLVTGAISIICFVPLMAASALTANVSLPAFQRKLDVRIYDGHCILPFWLATGTAAVTITGAIYFINR